MQVPESLGAECQQLIGQSRSLVFATSDKTGAPDAGLAPYVLVKGRFYILVSELARHTAHLMESGRCVLLFAEDESKSVNLFARKRLTVSCLTTVVERSDPIADHVLDAMASSLGPTVAMLRPLPDFHLVQLLPEKCNYVRGFGQAYRFNASDVPEIWHGKLFGQTP